MKAGGWFQSVQARVLAATLVGMALALTLTGWGLLHLFREHAERQFQVELTRHMHQVLARMAFAADGTPQLDPSALSDPRWTQPLSGLYWQISQIDGTVVQRSRSLWDQTLALPADAPANGEVHLYRPPGPDGQPLLVLEQSVLRTDTEDTPPRWTVAVAADTGPLEEAVQHFSGAVMGTLALLLSLLSLAAAAQVWVGLAPLRAVRHSLDRLNAGATQRLEGSWPSEVQPLAHGFNQALDRLDHHLQTARTQAGNLAHALKTPLAVLRQAAEHPGGTPPLADLVQEQVQLAQRQIDHHLRRARAAALAGHKVSTPMAPVVDGLIRVMNKIHASRNIHIASLPSDSDPCMAVNVDAQDLHDMLGNLLDNACQWATHRVVVRLVRADGSAQVHVEDDGPGIAPEQLHRLPQRGQRLDEQVPGSGLGLAIVDELAQLHGANLRLQNRPTPGHSGLQATLTLPLA
jgi:signal transduction histidine kinase